MRQYNADDPYNLEHVPIRDLNERAEIDDSDIPKDIIEQNRRIMDKFINPPRVR